MKHTDFVMKHFDIYTLSSLKEQQFLSLCKEVARKKFH